MKHLDWQLIRTWVFSCLAVALIVQPSAARAPIKKLVLPPILRNELNLVLEGAVDMSEASFRRNESAFMAALKKLLKRIDSASKKSNLAMDQRPHILKYMDAISEDLSKCRRASPGDRHTFLQKALKQIEGIYKLYQLDTYKVFFCPKDKSIWLQRGTKPQNPVNPGTLGNCGKLVS
jgi:hypothetical protein